jgi:hypothetical protein
MNLNLTTVAFKFFISTNTLINAQAMYVHAFQKLSVKYYTFVSAGNCTEFHAARIQ